MNEKSKPIVKAQADTDKQIASDGKSGWIRNAICWTLTALFLTALLWYCLVAVPRIAAAPRATAVYTISSVLLALALYTLLEFLAGATMVKLTDFGFGGLVLPAGFAWLTMEMPSFLVPVAFILSAPPELTNRSGYLFLGAFMFHYFHRSFVYPFAARSAAGRPMPFAIWASALAFTAANGTLQALDLLLGDGAAQGSPADLRTRLGAAVFAVGFLTNVHSDYLLRRLRAPGETGDKIPRGGAFELISGANLWGECVEWTGYALLSGAVGPCSFSLFTWCGLGARCIQKHRWYQEKFGDDYPSRRKRLIPFVW